jgi:hypothetical protein
LNTLFNGFGALPFGISSSFFLLEISREILGYAELDPHPDQRRQHILPEGH